MAPLELDKQQLEISETKERELNTLEENIFLRFKK